jgi:predicted ATPase
MRGGRREFTTFLPSIEDECDRMIDLLPAGRELDGHERQRVVSACEGNPLFCEQMVAMLGLDAANGADTAVPRTIRTLLAARLDRLASSQRGVLQAASVEGRVFHRSGLLDLVPDPAGVDDILDALVGYELISPHESQFAGDQASASGMP